MSQTTSDFDPGAIFQPDGPINPSFMLDCVRTLIRSLPLGTPAEPKPWTDRRMLTALTALTALRPRDEIEVMIGVQAISAYAAANQAWYLGANTPATPNGTTPNGATPHGTTTPQGTTPNGATPNGATPNGATPNGTTKGNTTTSTRHIAAAANAARAFDTMLRALERRQARSLAPAQERPASKAWVNPDPTSLMRDFRNRFLADNPAEGERPEVHPMTFSKEDLQKLFDFQEQARIDKENQGLDIANTEGILHGGGMIMPEKPTEAQKDYLERRLSLMYQREYEENVRKGINEFPHTRPMRPGDFVP